MNTKKVFYLLILLALIYNIVLMFSAIDREQEEEDKITLNIKTNLIETK